MKDLQSVLSRLGLSQYFDKFKEEGFEQWETVLEITESDLDALGVKLGHRRILQREIALSRGVPLDTQAAPSKASVLSQDRGSEENKLDRKGGTAAGAKRKYRRHPKNDENAPERPASAYVIFSNRIREELKPQNLSFTTIAKRVGERWQDLSPEAKEPYESEASLAKEKYHAEMAEYRTTKSYQKYQQYLANFKAKNSSTSEDKRPKLLQQESTGDYPTETPDSLPSNPDFRARRLGSTSSGGRCSTTSGLSSPASIVSATPALHPSNSSKMAIGSTSPTLLSPFSSTRAMPLGGSQSQTGTTDAYSERIMSEIGQQPLPYDDGGRRLTSTEGAFSEPFEGSIPHGRTGSRELPKRSGRFTSSAQNNLSDSSSKSSVASTWSSTSTSHSSILPPATLDKPKNTRLSLPPLAAVTGSPYGGSLAQADPVAARPNIEPLAVRGTRSSDLAPQPSQSPSASSSKGMKFDSSQLPLPYNICFGRQPLPRSENEAKLANIFDLEDIPGERNLLKNLTLQQEQALSPGPATPPGLPEPRHPPYYPRLPSLRSQPSGNIAEHDLHPNADPLSVLAYAGRLVGRDNRRSP